jgi:hypothetical protein
MDCSFLFNPMTNTDHFPRYKIYLLTVWEERGQESEIKWRFRLEDSVTGQQRGFVSLDKLVRALEQELADWVTR